MYQFKIKEQDSGGYRFELEGINILIEGFTFKDGRHLLSNPNKAIAYFNIEDNIYGMSNDPLNFPTVEALYDAIYEQYKTFTRNNRNKLSAA